MGGGPSREERAEQQRLADERTRAAAREERLLAVAEKPDPLAERVRSSRMSWLDSVEGKNGPVDVTKIEAMAPYLDLWNKSRSRRDGERMGTGALRLGAANQNPEIAARISEQRQTEREQEAGGNLENAFRLKDAEMRESYMPLMGLQQSRDLGAAGFGVQASQNATSAYGQWLSRPQRPSFWGQLALGGLSAASNLIKPMSI